MIKFTFKLKFWLIICVQIFILVLLFVYYQYSLIAGKKILLKLVPPRDPLSLFQGHYLALNYEISHLRAGEYFGPSDFRSRETVYLILEKKNNHFGPYAVSRQRPKKGNFIKGEIISNYKGNLWIKYGIESYFIPEEKAEEIEKKFRRAGREENLFVEVSINKFGEALIRKIFIGKEEIDLSKIGKVEKKIGTQERARDARRASDISQLKAALEIYFQRNKVYPTALSQLVPEILPSLPKDPLTKRDYFYSFYPPINPDHYHLGAILEDIDSGLLLNDDDFNSLAAGYLNGFNGLDPVYDIKGGVENLSK